MKIDISKIDLTDFNVVDCEFGGDAAVWCYPKMEGVKWDKDNLILRSSIWRKSDGQLISPGFKKFFNWSQEPNIFPPPDAMSAKINCVEKLDGSCLIVSKYNGELIIRTRRAKAETMLNGHEIELFQKKYPKAFNNGNLDNGHTLVFEWLTPSNQIVVRYTEPEIKLIGMIHHSDYSYSWQINVDMVAEHIGVQRPKYFQYKSLEEMLQNVTDLRGEEGVCVYYGNDQHIRKIKSTWYLSVHNFRNAMNLKNIVDLYLINDKPTYNEFCTIVENQFTWEGLQMARPLISTICDAMKEVQRIIDGMKSFVDKMTKNGAPNGGGRKAHAEHIISAYGITSRADIAFNILDKKELGDVQYKKLLFQVMAK